MHLQPCQAAGDMKDFTDCARQLGEILESIDSLMNTYSAGSVPPTFFFFRLEEKSKIAVQPHTAVVLLLTKHFMSTVIIPALETRR